MSSRRKQASSWSFLGATAVAALAFGVAWALWFREGASNLSDDDLREIEAFEEYERRKKGSAN